MDNSHITVTKQQGRSETTLSEGYDYTLQGAGQNNGQLTLLSPLEMGAKLTITRVVPLTQLAQYVQGDAFAAQSHENALDKLTMIVQQQQGELDTKIQTPQGDLGGKILGFDEQGQPQPLTISNGLIQQKDLIQVKPGTAILVNALGVHVLYGDGLGIYDSALSVQLGTGLDFDTAKKIKIRDWVIELIGTNSNNLASLQGVINNLVQRIAALEGGTEVAITFGNGLSVNTEGQVTVRPHLGIKVDDNGVSVKLGDGLEFDDNKNVKLADTVKNKIDGKADKVDIASAQDIANGTAGKVVDAAGLASTRFPALQIFETSGSFKVPDGVTKLRVRVVGGGGGSAGGTPTMGGAGGSGGGYSEGVFNVVAGDIYSVSVGAGGAAAANEGGGGAGGTSRFGDLIYATGGEATSGSFSGEPGKGVGGYINISGQSGMSGNSAANTYLNTFGGGSFLGSSVRAYAGSARAAFEWGAGGAAKGSIGSSAGAAGYHGVVIVEW